MSTAPEPTRDESPLVRASEISAGYGRIPVLQEVSLMVDPGEIVALMGANGAGKSTTLRTLAGEIGLDSGSIELFGAPAKGPLNKRSKQGLAYVLEERSVIPSLSCEDNLRLGPGGVKPALEMFPELEPLLRRRAGLLSGGEQQILTLARALATGPRLLLADELSLGLAPLIVERLLTVIREAADQRGLGVLLVEQQTRNALRFADRAYVMRRGRIVIDGAASDLLARADEIEATYLSGAKA